MNYYDFTLMFPDQDLVTAANFPSLSRRAETAVRDMSAYDPEELSAPGRAAFDTAVAMQIDYLAEHGAFEGSITSQSVNGVSAAFALSAGGADALKLSPLARAELRAAKLCVR